MVSVFEVGGGVVGVNDFKEDFSPSPFDLSDDADLTVLGLVGTGIAPTMFGADEHFRRIIREYRQNFIFWFLKAPLQRRFNLVVFVKVGVIVPYLISQSDNSPPSEQKTRAPEPIPCDKLIRP